MDQVIYGPGSGICPSIWPGVPSSVVGAGLKDSTALGTCTLDFMTQGDLQRWDCPCLLFMRVSPSF